VKRLAFVAGLYTGAAPRESMPEVLENQRAATRFRVLVEIADRQPAVSQGEIADAIGVTSQAVSEYIRELTEEGLVEMEGRSRYRITREGVDWLLRRAEDLTHYADRVTEDVLGTVGEDAAIAAERVSDGESVSLEMRDGLLHAVPGDEGPATGVATTDAEAGEDVGVTGFEGVIDLQPGVVAVSQVPPVRSGGSGAVDPDSVRKACAGADLTLAAGVEAVVALRKADIEPATAFAAGDVAAEAASRGLDVAVITAGDAVGRVTDPLREAGAEYEVTRL